MTSFSMYCVVAFHVSMVCIHVHFCSNVCACVERVPCNDLYVLSCCISYVSMVCIHVHFCSNVCACVHNMHELGC